MAKLYIANCTKQTQDFIYRVLEDSGLRRQRIEVGTQIALSGDLSTKDIEYIVEQHARYGMVPDTEVKSTKPFVGTCYAIDRPVKLDYLRLALSHNDVVLTERGQTIRKEAAVAINNQIESSTGQPLKNLEVEVSEDTKNKESEFNETVQVTRGATGKPTVPRRSRSRQRA